MLLCAARRRYFPAAPLWSLALGGLCLAFASPVLVLTVEASFYQVPISCAFCLYLGMLLAVYRALHSSRRPEVWLGAASLLFGLTVGARPDYLLGGFALFVPCAWLVAPEGRPAAEGKVATAFARGAWGCGGASSSRRLAPRWSAAPGLALYNGLRFGSIFEFGMRYQLGGGEFPQSAAPQPRPSDSERLCLPLRIRGLAALFPLLRARRGQALRHGALRALDLAGPGRVPGPGRGGDDGEFRRQAVRWCGPIGATWAANVVLLSCFFGTTDRYLSDYVPAGLLLGGIGAMALVGGGQPVPALVRRWLLPPLWASRRRRSRFSSVCWSLRLARRART